MSTNQNRFDAKVANESNEGNEMYDSFEGSESIDAGDSFETNESVDADDANDLSDADEAEKKKRKKKDYGVLSQLETYRLILSNVQSQPVLAQCMAEIGYTSEVLDQGRAQCEEARQAYEMCLASRQEKARIYQEFRTQWADLKEQFKIHREKARVIFRGNEAVYKALSLKGTLSKSYLPLIARMKHFYTRISVDEGLKQELEGLSLTADDVSNSLNKIKEVEELRANYMKKKAESQDSTDKKNKTFKKSEQWTRDFFSLAKYAVSASPQLQEAFGKIIKS